MCQEGKQTDRQKILQPTARHPHIDDKGKKSLLNGPLRTETDKQKKKTHIRSSCSCSIFSSVAAGAVAVVAVIAAAAGGLASFF